MPKQALHHVHIKDDRTGELLADVDATSAADGLAYYLRSRHIVEDASEQTIKDATGNRRGVLLFEQRAIGTGNVLHALSAEVVA